MEQMERDLFRGFDVSSLVPPPLVLLVGDHLRVVRVDAHSHTAGVVKLLLGRHWSVLDYPHDLVDSHGGPIKAHPWVAPAPARLP